MFELNFGTGTLSIGAGGVNLNVAGASDFGVTTARVASTPTVIDISPKGGFLSFPVGSSDPITTGKSAFTSGFISFGNGTFEINVPGFNFSF
jgi:hypothetical protein